MVSKPIVDVVEIRLPPVNAVYQLTLIWKVPVSSPAGTFTYAATAYEVAAVTEIREAIATPELAPAAFVTSRHEEPKNASVVIRAIVESFSHCLMLLSFPYCSDVKVLFLIDPSNGGAWIFLRIQDDPTA